MAKKSERKRITAIKSDLLAYRREVPEGAIKVDMLGGVSYEECVVLVGRIMLADRTGKISRLGVFDILKGKKVIVLERIEANGASIPVYMVRTPENIRTINTLIHYGDVVMLEGNKLYVKNNDVFLAKRITLLSKAVGDVYDSNIDFQKRSNLYTYRYLQLMREPEKISLFRDYSRVFRTIRQFLYRKGYEELSITLLQESFEAGLANPFVTYVIECNRNMYLRLTSEFFLRKLMIAGFSKVFVIGKSFRNQGATHDMLPQFTILELYCAYARREEMEQLLHNMLCDILVEIYGSVVIPTESGDIDCSGDWAIYDFRNEVKRYTGSAYDEKRSVEELALLLDKAGITRPRELNKYTIATALYTYVVSKIKGPVFLRNLPAAQSPLSKLNRDNSTVDETLLIINGMLIADLVNPERDPKILRGRMEEQLEYRGKNQDYGINENILQAMKFGLPPSRGIGMGLERLLMLLFNRRDIRDVDLFPVF